MLWGFIFPVTERGKENPNDNMDIYDRADFISHMAVCSDLDGKEDTDDLAAPGLIVE